MKCVNFINCWFISILSLLQPLNNGTPGQSYMLTPLYGVLCVFPAEFPGLGSNYSVDHFWLMSFRLIPKSGSKVLCKHSNLIR